MSPVSKHRLLILTAALLFSTGGAAIKATSLTGWQVACFRSGLAGLALMIAMPAWRRWWRPKTVVVGLAYAATMVLYVTANKMTTAANTIFLQSTAPIYLLLLGPLLLQERVRRNDLALTVIMAAGLAMFFIGIDAPAATAPQPFRGNIIAALSGLSWALTILGLRWLGRDGSGAAASAGGAVIAGNLIASLFCLPFALPVLDTGLIDWTIILYLGLFQIGLAYICMTFAVRRLPALEASLLLLLEPVLNAIWAWLIHAERPGTWSLAGCVVILAATLARTLSGAGGGKIYRTKIAQKG
jgi:drug/metabolite transporter (DMT)-like permease